MTDKNFTAEQREIIETMFHHASVGEFLEGMSHYVRDLKNLRPNPPHPTLADMNEEERAACLRMQCDTAPNRSVRGFIADIYPGGCRVIERDTWEWRSCSDDMVTPRPDLPRLEWPGNKKVAPDLPGDWRVADHKDLGRVIVTNPTPDCYGTVYFAFPRVDLLGGLDWKFCDPDELTYLDTDDTRKETDD